MRGFLSGFLKPTTLTTDNSRRPFVSWNAQRASPSRQAFHVKLHGLAPWARDAVKLMEKNMSAYFGCACRLAFAGSRLRLFQPKVFAALDLIAKAWPDAAAEIDDLVRDVVILRGKPLESPASSVPLVRFTFARVPNGFQRITSSPFYMRPRT